MRVDHVSIAGCGIEAEHIASLLFVHQDRPRFWLRGRGVNAPTQNRLQGIQEGDSDKED